MEEAEGCISKAYEIVCAIFGEHNNTSSEIHCSLADIMSMQGKGEQAIVILEKELLYQLDVYGPKDRSVAYTYGLLMEAYGRVGNMERAIEYCNKSNSIFSELDLNSDICIARNHIALGKFLANSKKYVEAENQLLIAKELIDSTDTDVTDRDIIMTYIKLGQIQMELNKKEKAIESLKVVVANNSKVKFKDEIEKAEEWIKILISQ